MAEVYNVDNVKKIIRVLAELGNAIGGMLEDKKVDQNDFKEIDHLLPIISELSTTNYKMIVPEIKDISPAEGQEIVTYFSQYFDIPQDVVETPIEFTLNVISSNVNNVVLLIKMIKRQPTSV